MIQIKIPELAVRVAALLLIAVSMSAIVLALRAERLGDELVAFEERRSAAANELVKTRRRAMLDSLDARIAELETRYDDVVAVTRMGTASARSFIARHPLPCRAPHDFGTLSRLAWNRSAPPSCRVTPEQWRSGVRPPGCVLSTPTWAVGGGS